VAGYTSTEPTQGVVLSGTSALQCAAGVIGSNAGQAYDSVLYGVYVKANTPAAALTVGGLKNSAGSAQNLLITGLTTTDFWWMPPVPILNMFAAFTFTPSISNVISVYLRAYVGPERPQTRVNT
jgi:hypothetical protein